MRSPSAGSRIEFRDRVGQQRVFSGVADPRRRGEDQPSRAPAGVLGDLRDLRHVPKFVRLAQLPLADRSGVWIEQRHDPVLDRLARHALLDLPADFLAPVGELLQPARRVQLRLRAAATRGASRGRRELPCLGDRAGQQLAGLLGQLQDLALRLPAAATDRAG
jgi:hypothetical protein